MVSRRFFPPLSPKGRGDFSAPSPLREMAGVRVNTTKNVPYNAVERSTLIYPLLPTFSQALKFQMGITLRVMPIFSSKLYLT